MHGDACLWEWRIVCTQKLPGLGSLELGRPFCWDSEQHSADLNEINVCEVNRMAAFMSCLGRMKGNLLIHVLSSCHLCFSGPVHVEGLKRWLPGTQIPDNAIMPWRHEAGRGSQVYHSVAAYSGPATRCTGTSKVGMTGKKTGGSHLQCARLQATLPAEPGMSEGCRRITSGIEA